MTDNNDFPIDLSVETILDEMEIRYNRHLGTLEAKYMGVGVYFREDVSIYFVAFLLKKSISEKYEIKEGDE